MNLRVEGDSKPPESLYRRDLRAGDSFPSLHVKTRCTGFLKPCRMHQHTLHARTIVRYLQKRGAWVARIRGTWGQRKGLPDILACWQGRLIAIEVKTGKGRLTPEQRREHEALRTAGAVVLVGNAVEVIHELERLTQEPQARLL